MTEFKIGDAVWIKTDSEPRLTLFICEIYKDQFLCGYACGNRKAWKEYSELELVNRPDPQADIKQAIREVLLSDEFMMAFTKKAFGAKVEASLPTFTTLQNVSTERSLEHPIPGVNRPMRNEAQLSQMVEMVRQSLTTEPANPSESPNSSTEPTKRFYRDPTKDDLKNGPIDCEVRNSDGEQWVWRILCRIADGSDYPFRVLRDRLMDSKAKWPQCRIEVTDDA